MKRILAALTVLLPLFCGCNHNQETPDEPHPGPSKDAPAFAKGADISWVTEMESNGYKFYDASGHEMECTALLRSIGFNSIRLRVWVNPQGGWCAKEDVLVKARRAMDLGMNIMIDFHYSDWWADPGKQNIPAAWKNYSLEQLVAAVSDHTEEVLGYLKDNGIDVTWVQVGNETTTGMLWPVGKLTDEDPFSFCKLFNSGYDAVKRVYPDALVIMHRDNGWDISGNNWYWDLVNKGGARYDMIGFSLYPSYWDESAGEYPDWRSKCRTFVSYISLCHVNYDKPVMLVEFGMPASQPDKAEDALRFLLDGTASYDWFKGIFFWEPESDGKNMRYDYGAFKDGTPTSALNPFNDR